MFHVPKDILLDVVHFCWIKVVIFDVTVHDNFLPFQMLLLYDDWSVECVILKTENCKLLCYELHPDMFVTLYHLNCNIFICTVHKNTERNRPCSHVRVVQFCC